jgi:hypothetical protein
VALVIGTPLVLVASVVPPAAPPTYYVPGANGVALPPGVQSYDIALDDTLFPLDELIAVVSEIHFANPALVPPLPLGWYPLHWAFWRGGRSFDKTLAQIVRTQHFGGDIQSRAADGSFYHPYPDAVRLRVDAIAARLTTVTLTVS